jgi:hypothetical protein
MFEWDSYSIYDLVALENKDEYTRYITDTLTAFKTIELVYKIKSERDSEAVEEYAIVLNYLKKIIYTFDTIRLKYLYNPTDFLRIDKSDSGFVNFYEILQLETELAKNTPKPSLADEDASKEKLLISLLQKGHDDAGLLTKLARIKYLRKLDGKNNFLLFNEGTLTLKEEDGQGKRKYLYYWACFDRLTNRPFIYLLDFEQDADVPALHEDEAMWKRFITVIKSEGSRAPAAGVVAMAIDQRLENIHPKLLKRICLGPIYSKSFSEELDDDLKEFLLVSDDGREFIFHITEQFVCSFGQTIIKDSGTLGQLAETRKVRERFFIPQPSDIYEYTTFDELDTQKASFIRKSVIMPYKLHQHLARRYKGYHVISFSRSGNINGI